MLLEVKGLEVHYGGIRAVKGIDFQVAQGELVCLIGANGAGKTSTLKAICRLLPLPSSGSKSPRWRSGWLRTRTCACTRSSRARSIPSSASIR